jgi:hypothetical protein
MTKDQAIKLYASFTWEPAVGVDSDGNPTTNPTPASTLMFHYAAPTVDYGYLHGLDTRGWRGTAEAATFLRRLADALEQP